MAEAYTIPSANDILSYQGNAGLAAGAGTGLLPSKINPLEGVDSSLDKIQALNHQKEILNYKAKQEQQDKLAQMLAETGGSVFNMKNAAGQNVSFSPLPQDQKILTDKAHELRRMILEHPDNYMFNEDYLDKKNAYSQLTNHAGVRASAASQYNQDAQKAADPDERANILAHKQSELGSSLLDGKAPEPYLAKPAIVDPISSNKDYRDRKNLQEYGTTIEKRTDANGNQVDYEVKKIGIPATEILKPLNDVSTTGTEYIKNAAIGFWTHPETQNPDYITKMNQDIVEKAKAMGIQPYFAATVRPDGTIQHNPNPREVATALNIEKYGKLQDESKPTDAIRKNEQFDLQEEKTRHDMKIADENLALKKIEADEKSSKISKPTAEQLKEDLYKKSATSTYDDVNHVFTSATSRPPVEPQYPNYWKKNGIDPAKYTIYPDIPKGQADKFIGIQAPEITDKSTKGGEVTTTKSKEVSIIPDKVVPIKDKTTGESKLAYWKDGKVVSVVPEKEAIVNSLKHESRYDPKLYENRTAWVDEIYGKGPQQSGTTNGASQGTSNSSTQPVPKIRPSNIPGTATLGKSGYYRDKKTGKIYDPVTGMEI